EFRLVEKLGLRILTLESPEYPELLQSIYDPPPVLYCQGRPLNGYTASLAVVGTRTATNYGRLMTEKLVSALAERGVGIVSGMARGIDTLAHRAALQGGGETVAVLGCGLGNTYPPENVSLRERIVERGTVVSEFPVTMRPEKNNFPARNRVISGLSYGTVVVEAGETSGALITAQFALEQGREVFAVPGNINSPASRGTNQLIQTGAKLVDGPEAILEELPFPVRETLKEKESSPGHDESLSEEERKIFSLLSHEEKHIDSLIENSQLSPAEVSATLLKLELRGWIRQLGGKMYISNRSCP
ncbi:MAG: DNA-protecting protein DprA, partial [Nitrospinaceae bacterium]|nr:DNA-protecting protein DprA [Nitrospinaceae bacterium]NIR55531.1 DNA-protecting protein DprA [Nitrospinaceae bacterium]NIS85965.1 DNA-protecting protein DprA [Nitrospinaceae bacterium]NIT82811.1 DNA-protecting protein DprA [Nitrospinaceae bacterium]NIU45013.1 DNA-protecting protein DprA [Nitrospinaceae bacterium]